MFNSVEKIEHSNISATTSAFTLRGGNYSACVIGSGFGTVTLQRLALDGTTWVTALTAFSAAGMANSNLPSGSYRWAISSATAVYCELLSVVTTQ